MLNEQDIEMLELELDGDLTADESAALKQRRATEPELAACLKGLEEGRAQRMRLWQSFEPSGQEEAERILASLHAKAERRAWYIRILDHREQIAAAAACIAVFLIGWQWGRNADAYRMTPTGAPTARPVSLITQQQVPAGSSTVYEVRVNDSSGKLIRVERFGSLQEAQRFIEEMRRQLQK